MKTISTLKALLVAALLSSGISANATVVTASQNQTTDGQNFTFALSTPGYLTDTASKLTVRVQGDFNGGSGQSEAVTVFIEGVNKGTFAPVPASAGVYDIVDYRTGTANTNALAFSIDFLLSALDTKTYLLDGDLDVVVDFNSGVNTQCGWSNNQNCLVNVGTSPFARASLDYQTAAVPEPMPIALVGIGLLGFAASRRKSAKSKNA
jgi:hypothetical protein